MKTCEKSFMNGTLMYGPRGGEYILIRPKSKKGNVYKKYCKIKESNKRKLANKIMKGYRPTKNVM